MSAQSPYAAVTASKRNVCDPPHFVGQWGSSTFHCERSATMVLDKLFRSFDVVLRQKHSLTTKATQLAQTERDLVDKLSRALSSVGYRVVPLSEAGTTSRRGAGRKMGGKPKILRCPHCERMFAHPLPMARHIKATHIAKKAVAKRARRRIA